MARNASGEVRRDGVTSNDPLLSRAASAGFAPSVAASSGGKEKAWLSPPSSTAMRGRGNGSILAAKLCVAPARGAGVAPCRGAVHGAESTDNVIAGIAVMDRRRDQVEAMLRNFRVLDVQGVGL